MKNLLISCVGAYHDSGIGTGGCLVVSNGETLQLDFTDSTGLFRSDRYYCRFVRSDKALVFYADDGIRKILFLSEVQDAHDILIYDGLIYCVSTMSNDVLVYSMEGELRERIHFKGVRDAWHLNCLTVHNDQIFISAFGRFDEHREWNAVGCREQGFVISVRDEKTVVEGLSGPHNPRFIDGKWMVCDSHKHCLAVFDQGIRRDIKLGGFTRGFTYDESYLYVGVSADRKSTVQGSGAKIVVLDRRTLEPVDAISIGMPEIYDIIFVSDGFVSNLKENADRFAYSSVGVQHKQHLENQIRLGEVEVGKLKSELGELKSNYRELMTKPKTFTERVALKINRIFGLGQ